MANLIQIKRSEGNATIPSLANGELAWTANGEGLYIGNFGANQRIGGAMNPGVLTANQALVANSTSGIDALDTDSFTLSNYTITGILDSDTMAGVSNLTIATSESIKAYVDDTITAISNGVTTLAALTDVDVTGVANASMIVYDTGSGTWYDQVLSGDVTMSNGGVVTLATVATGATVGNSTYTAGVTFNDKGLVTGALPVPIDHDLLTNFATNEHVDHSTVNILQGDGLNAAGNGDITASRTVAVLANNGIIANSFGTFVDGANGISVTVDGVNVLAGNSQITSNSTGVWIQQSQLSIATSQVTGDVALGTNTSGNYVESIIAANGILGAAANSEGSDHVLYVDAEDGLLANTTGLWVVGANGISVDVSGVNVLAGNTQLTSNSTGLWVNQTQIDHDLLSNFASDEHVAHSTIDIIAGNGLTGGGSIDADRTLTVQGNNGITVTSDGVFADGANGISVTSAGINVLAGTGVVSNATGVHIGQAVGTTDNVQFNDIIASGNLTINGTLTTVDTTNLIVEDPLIQLARLNNATDTVDIGFYGLYDTSGSQDLYGGLFRDATDGYWKLFVDNQAEPTTTVNTLGTGYTVGTLVANLRGGTVTNLTTDIAVADGGTGLSTLASWSILYGNGTSAMGALAKGTSGQVLQVSADGNTLLYDSLDGGTF